MTRVFIIYILLCKLSTLEVLVFNHDTLKAAHLSHPFIIFLL